MKTVLAMRLYLQRVHEGLYTYHDADPALPANFLALPSGMIFLPNMVRRSGCTLHDIVHHLPHLEFMMAVAFLSIALLHYITTTITSAVYRHIPT